MKCYTCSNTADERPHHIIFRNKIQFGTNHPKNLVCLCAKCHTQIHHGKDIERKKEIMKKLYDLIRNDLELCYNKSKTGNDPKVINLIRVGEL